MSLLQVVTTSKSLCAGAWDGAPGHLQLPGNGSNARVTVQGRGTSQAVSPCHLATKGALHLLCQQKAQRGAMAFSQAPHFTGLTQSGSAPCSAQGDTEGGTGS